MSKLIVNQLQAYSGSLITFVDGTSAYISGSLVVVGSTTAASISATTLTGTLSTAAQTNITSVGTLSSLAVSGNLAVDTNTLFVDAANNRVGVGTASPAYALSTVGIVSSTTEFRLNNSYSRAAILRGGGGIAGGYNVNESLQHDSTGTLAAYSYDTDGSVRFYTGESAAAGTAATERMRILPTGGLTFNGDTSTANALDDYEEGTWTPVVADANSGGNLATLTADSYGAYTKIGNVVYFRFNVLLSSKGSMSSGNEFWVRGFPYTSVPISGNWYNPSSVIIRNTTFSGYVQFHQVGGSTYGYFRFSESGGTGDNILVSQTTDSSGMQVSGFYSIS
jgi:roadblock/LC7 domain-containing protein